MWARGYFCASVGAVTSAQVEAYIAAQDDQPKDITVWDEQQGEGFDSPL